MVAAFPSIDRTPFMTALSGCRAGQGTERTVSINGWINGWLTLFWHSPLLRFVFVASVVAFSDPEEYAFALVCAMTQDQRNSSWMEQLLQHFD